jgi:NAD(P)-dependent dehydrogenase (short-subunit alcohol dehydrogenase family)
MRFDGRRVMVVGAASGLGEAATRAFAAEGAKLVLVDLDADRLTRLAAQLPIAAVTVPGDAADAATAETAIAAAGGVVDVLFIAAGVDPKSATDVPGTSLADWSAVMAVNVTAAFLFARATLPGMIAAGAGSILFTSSIAGLKPARQEAVYSVSKAALIQLARCIAIDHAAQGVRANCLCPGYLEAVMRDRRAVMSDADLRARSEAAQAAIPMGREGSYAEMADLVLFLCDHRAANYVTGQAFAADGGVLLT